MDRGRDPGKDIADSIIEHEESKVPRSWVGKEVLVYVFQSEGVGQESGYLTPAAVVPKAGMILSVNEFGIHGVFVDAIVRESGLRKQADQEPEHIFYSWGGVVSIQPVE